MGRLNHVWSMNVAIMLGGVFIALGLQGCDLHIYQHRVLDKTLGDERPTVPAGQDDCGAKGCDPTAYTGNAAGFVGIGGASPVPDPPGTANDYMCNAGSIKCGNEGSSGCSLRFPNKQCKTTFTYPAGGGLSGPCKCECLNP